MTNITSRRMVRRVIVNRKAVKNVPNKRVRKTEANDIEEINRRIKVITVYDWSSILLERPIRIGYTSKKKYVKLLR